MNWLLVKRVLIVLLAQILGIYVDERWTWDSDRKPRGTALVLRRLETAMFHHGLDLYHVHSPLILVLNNNVSPWT